MACTAGGPAAGAGRRPAGRTTRAGQAVGHRADRPALQRSRPDPLVLGDHRRADGVPRPAGRVGRDAVEPAVAASPRDLHGSPVRSPRPIGPPPGNRRRRGPLRRAVARVVAPVDLEEDRAGEDARVDREVDRQRRVVLGQLTDVGLGREAREPDAFGLRALAEVIGLERPRAGRPQLLDQRVDRVVAVRPLRLAARSPFGHARWQ